MSDKSTNHRHTVQHPIYSRTIILATTGNNKLYNVLSGMRLCDTKNIYIFTERKRGIQCYYDLSILAFHLIIGVASVVYKLYHGSECCNLYYKN